MVGDRWARYRLTGKQVCSMMRKHGHTIRGLATKYQITQKRVRTVRAEGVTGFIAAEWIFMLTGSWPDTAT